MWTQRKVVGKAGCAARGNVSDAEMCFETEKLSETRKPAPDKACFDVSDKTPETHEEEKCYPRSVTLPKRSRLGNAGIPASIGM